MTTLRPTYDSLEVRTKISHALAKEIFPLCKHTVTFEELEEDIRSIWQPNTDGYTLCKDLEYLAKYRPNTEFVRVFHEISAYQILKSVIRDWVAKEQPVPDYEVGDQVFVFFEEEMVTGELIRIDTISAEYHVFCEEKGHVRNGLGVRSFVVPYEQVGSLIPADRLAA